MFDPNHRPPWYCPICREWMGGLERRDHMIRHTRAETARHIEEETGATLADVVDFCLQDGIEIDDLAADDPMIAQVIILWNAGDDDLDDEELDRLVGIDPSPDPEIWGDLVGELAADDGDAGDLPYFGDIEEPVAVQLTILWEVNAGTLVTFAGRVTAVEGYRFRVHDSTDDVAVELDDNVDAFFAVGDLVEVIGRKIPGESGYYILADQVETVGRQGRGA